MRGSIQYSLLKVEEEDWRETEREGGLSPQTRLFHYFWRGKAEQGRARQSKASEQAANIKISRHSIQHLYLERVPNTRLVVQHHPNGTSFIFAVAIRSTILCRTKQEAGRIQRKTL